VAYAEEIAVPCSSYPNENEVLGLGVKLRSMFQTARGVENPLKSMSEMFQASNPLQFRCIVVGEEGQAAELFRASSELTSKDLETSDIHPHRGH